MSPNEKLLKQNILRNHAIKLLNDRGVELKDISDIVFDLQKSYVDDLTHEMCLHNVEKV